MGERAPYSRVYWSVVDDPKFASIYGNNDHLATWLRLLIGADAIWPASATLPRNARAKSVEALVEARLVDLLPGDRYRIHGLDSERNRRKVAATTRTPDGDQTVPDPEPNQSPNGPSHARDALLVSSSSSSADLGSGPHVGDQEAPEWPVLIWLSEHKATVPPSGGGLHRKVIRLVDKHGAQAVIRAMAALGDGMEPNQYVLGADNALNPIPSASRETPAERKQREIAEERAEAQRRMAVQ